MDVFWVSMRLKTIFILLIFLELSSCRHVTKRGSKIRQKHDQTSFVDTSPLIISQYTGKGVQDTGIQVPLDEAIPKEALTGKAKARDLSSYMDTVPQDDTKESIIHLLDTLAGDKRWSGKHVLARKKSNDDFLSRQLLAAANTAEFTQQVQGSDISQQASEISQQASDNSDEKNEDDIAIKEGMLAHNSFRLLHHVQPLQWNESLAQQAQRIAKTIASDPSSFQGESPGENIAQIWHDFPHAPLKASNIWYSERKDYSFSYPKFSDQVRHFTQMVWKGTTQVGLGIATSPSEKYKIVVALYWPLGNDVHPKELEANIPKPGGGTDVYATLKWDITRPKKNRKRSEAQQKNTKTGSTAKANI